MNVIYLLVNRARSNFLPMVVLSTKRHFMVIFGGGGVVGGLNSMLLYSVPVLVVLQFTRHNRCNMLAHDGFKTLTLSKLNCSRLIKQEQC